MLPSGKTKPDSMNAGRKLTRIAVWLATSTELARELMKMPRARQDSRNSATPAPYSSTLPRNGMPKTKIAMSVMTTASSEAKPIQGMTLPITSSCLRSGDTRSCSSVPLSSSRTRLVAVCWTVTIMMITTMRPGIRYAEDRASGLYQRRM